MLESFINKKVNIYVSVDGITIIYSTEKVDGYYFNTLYFQSGNELYIPENSDRYTKDGGENGEILCYEKDNMLIEIEPL